MILFSSALTRVFFFRRTHIISDIIIIINIIFYYFSIFFSIYRAADTYEQGHCTSPVYLSVRHARITVSGEKIVATRKIVRVPKSHAINRIRTAEEMVGGKKKNNNK